MSVFEFNCLYAAKALFLVFVIAPLLFMLGISLVYAVSQFLGQHLECDHSAPFSDFTLQKVPLLGHRPVPPVRPQHTG